MIQKLREQTPLVHCITNYVTARDVANIILAAGGSPIMADYAEEVEEIQEKSDSLVLNMGTLNKERLHSMMLAGTCANRLGHPVILDPVGVAASSFRRNAAEEILTKISCSVIRGNYAEIVALAGVYTSSHGVDNGTVVNVNDVNVDVLKSLSKRTGAVVVMTGEEDILADSKNICIVKNGNSMMKRITGCGCMMDGILAAFQAIESKEDRFKKFEKAIYGTLSMGICGEIAYEENIGTGSFGVKLFDAMSLLTDSEIERRKNCEYKF